MAGTEHIERINASADKVWPFIDWLGTKKLVLAMTIEKNDISQATNVEKMDIDGDKIGSIRTVHFEGGNIIKSQLVERDIANKYYRYRMLDTGDFPFTEYMNQIWVTPCGPDSCEYKCKLTLSPKKGVSAKDLLDSWVDYIKDTAVKLRELAGAD